jgi:uncharacterized membrane protein YhhN
MQRNYWLIIFFAALLANLTGTLLESDILVYCSKPLLVGSLMGWLVSSTKGYTGAVYKWPLAALFFSLCGDVLLMFEKMNLLFFIIGLICFLISHIFYIIIFNQIRVQKNIPIKWWMIIIILCYYSILLSTLFPYLGEMKLPVVIYGAVISTMFFVALHLLFYKSKANMHIVIGAVLFVASDSILAFNKFYSSFNSAGLLIMLTYAFAQYYITKGIVSNSSHEQ